MIAIIDYDAGNIKSVEKALHYLGEETTVTRDPQTLLNADKVILPGVGSFGQAMENLHTYGLVPVIHEIVEMFHHSMRLHEIVWFVQKLKLICM